MIAANSPAHPRAWSGGSHPLEFSLLQHAEGTSLESPAAGPRSRPGRFVPPSGQLEAPLPLPTAPRERALLMTEQFAFPSVGGSAAQLDRPAAPAMPPAPFVQRPREQLLARFRRTQQQHARVGWSDLLQPRQGQPQGGGFRQRVSSKSWRFLISSSDTRCLLRAGSSALNLDEIALSAFSWRGAASAAPRISDTMRQPFHRGCGHRRVGRPAVNHQGADHSPRRTIRARPYGTAPAWRPTDVATRGWSPLGDGHQLAARKALDEPASVPWSDLRPGSIFHSRVERAHAPRCPSR